MESPSGTAVTPEEKRWILNDWANSAYSVVITTAVLPVYYKKVASRGLEGDWATALWAYGNTLATLLVAVLAPLLGTLADYRGRKMGLFRFFTLWGTATTALLVLVGTGDWALCLLLYVLSAIGFAGSNIFYDAFLVDVTDGRRMDWISSLGFGWGYFGSTIPFVLSITLIQWPDLLGLSTAGATRAAFLLTALWWLGFSLPMMLGVRQRYGLPPEPRPFRSSLLRLGGTLREVRRYRGLLLFLLAYFFYIDGVGTIIKMAGVFGADLGIDTGRLMLIFLVIQITAFPFSLVYGRLARRLGNRPPLFLGIGVYVVVCAYAPFIRTEREFWILALMVASSQGGIQALSRSAFGAMVPREKSAEFFGFYNVFGRFAAVLGPLLYGLAVQMTGSARFAALALVPLFGLGAWLLWKSGNAIRQEALNRARAGYPPPPSVS